MKWWYLVVALRWGGKNSKRDGELSPSPLFSCSQVLSIGIHFPFPSLIPFYATEMIVDNQIETGLLKADMKDKVTYTLLRKHRHQTKKSNLRSLADIGKTVSSASRMFTNPDNGNAEANWL